MRFAITLALLSGLTFRSVAAADEVTKWNQIEATASVNSGLVDNPLFDSRVIAIMHAAIHDALASIDRRSRPYAFHGTAAPGASPQAAVAAAARRKARRSSRW